MYAVVQEKIKMKEIHMKNLRDSYADACLAWHGTKLHVSLRKKNEPEERDKASLNEIEL